MYPRSSETLAKKSVDLAINSESCTRIHVTQDLFLDDILCWLVKVVDF